MLARISVVPDCRSFGVIAPLIPYQNNIEKELELETHNERLQETHVFLHKQQILALPRQRVFKSHRLLPRGLERHGRMLCLPTRLCDLCLSTAKRGLKLSMLVEETSVSLTQSA